MELARNLKIKSLTVYTPINLTRALAQVSTCAGAVQLAEAEPGLFPSLARIRREFGNEKTELLIQAYLVHLAKMVNLKRNLSEGQIELISAEVCAKYYSLSMADVHVIFRRAICGEWGNLYESLDVPKVMNWFSLYFEEKCAIGQNQAISSNTDKNGNATFDSIIKQFRIK